MRVVTPARSADAQRMNKKFTEVQLCLTNKSKQKSTRYQVRNLTFHTNEGKRTPDKFTNLSIRRDELTSRTFNLSNDFGEINYQEDARDYVADASSYTLYVKSVKRLPHCPNKLIYIYIYFFFQILWMNK